MAPVKHGHTKIQRRLVDAFASALHSQFISDKEIPSQPLPEYEAWVADVAVMTATRWEATPEDGYLQGVPEIVIEVLSPSNTATEMLEREAICLQNGGREFWLVDPALRSIKITDAAGRTRSYGVNDEISLGEFGGAIRVSEVFPSR